MTATEAKIHADIEALRDTVLETQALYREVCAILFFRYGITPTANKLYQYVRKGSMSAPAEALAKFWEELREKSRIRIEHPDLPEPMKAAAGELVSVLWSQAQAAAQEGLQLFRVEAQSAVLEAQTGKAVAEDGRTVALKDLELARQANQAAADRTLDMERELAAERASKEAFAAQIEESGRQRIALEVALTDARRDFKEELQKLRQALQRSEERLEASEKRALLEIDRERTAAARAHKEITQLRQTHQEIADRNRTDVTQLQRELGEASQRFGMAEGTLQELRAAHLQQAEQVHALRGLLAERDTDQALLQRDLENSRNHVAALEEKLRQLRVEKASSVKERKARKRVIEQAEQ